jgi:hypothetical protein
MGREFQKRARIFLSEGAYALQCIYVFSLGDSCSQGDLDVVGYEYLKYDGSAEHASSDDKEQDLSKKICNRGRN